jgi:hypothetical protein
MTECAVSGLGSSSEAENLSKHFLREEFPGFGKNEQGIISCDFFPDESQKYPFHIYSFLSWILCSHSHQSRVSKEIPGVRTR